MEDDSDSCGMMLSSQPKSWDFCPESTIFRIKIIKEDNDIVKFMYNLREGVPLPYNPDIPKISDQGKKLVFMKDMQPTINYQWSARCSKDRKWENLLVFSR